MAEGVGDKISFASLHHENNWIEDSWNRSRREDRRPDDTIWRGEVVGQDTVSCQPFTLKC